MRFTVSSAIKYEVSGPSTLILNVHVLRNGAQLVSEESFVVEPRVKCEEFVLDQGQNRFVRIETAKACELTIKYRAAVSTQVQIIPMKQLTTTSVARVDRNVIPFIYPSRYCQSDKLGRLAMNKFGRIENHFQQVTAISDWIFENVQYLSGSTNWQTSAYDTVTERAGVCRDFAHLGIALCRALNIPARYFAGYAHMLNPPDFHACFEAYISGKWLIFDPTRLVPLNGMARIATGRDAADSSVATLFGPVMAKEIEVKCEPAEPGFIPLPVDQLAKKGVCLDAP